MRNGGLLYRFPVLKQSLMLTPSCRSLRQIIEMAELWLLRTKWYWNLGVVVTSLDLPIAVTKQIVFLKTAESARLAAKSAVKLRHTDRLIAPNDFETTAT